jgi:mRNA-degrading endonuclease RelE of RelBE toxin-antitoxin system
MYRIDTTPEFDRDIKAIDKPTTSRIINKIEWLSINPNVLKHLLKHMPSDLRGLQKYRVGDYRVLL